MIDDQRGRAGRAGRFPRALNLAVAHLSFVAGGRAGMAELSHSTHLTFSRNNPCPYII